MKNKLIKYGSLAVVVLLLISLLIVPASAAVSEPLTAGMILLWDESPSRPFTGTTDYSVQYEFGFYDARGYYCKGMNFYYRSSDGFYIDYIYDDAKMAGQIQVYNDGSGREDAFWADYARYITIVSTPPTELAIYLQANTSLSQGGTFTEGYDSGYLAGYNKGKAEGYAEGYTAGGSASDSQNLGKNLLGDTLNAPMNALNQFVLYDPPGSIPPITLGTVLGGVISLTLFIAFLKIFAGG